MLSLMRRSKGSSKSMAREGSRGKKLGYDDGDGASSKRQEAVAMAMAQVVWSDRKSVV